MLRLELFVISLDDSIDFYSRVLQFTMTEQKEDGYTVMKRDGLQISLQARDVLPDDHPIKPKPSERTGLGIEIVLEINGLEALYANVQAQGWALSQSLQKQPWGSVDFRVFDPNGYYLRIQEQS
jgi:uncharacterized glyoxalase superfamily protein PhnB